MKSRCHYCLIRGVPAVPAPALACAGPPCLVSRTLPTLPYLNPFRRTAWAFEGRHDLWDCLKLYCRLTKISLQKTVPVANRFLTCRGCSGKCLALIINHAPSPTRAHRHRPTCLLVERSAQQTHPHFLPKHQGVRSPFLPVACPASQSFLLLPSRCRGPTLAA